MPSHIYIRTGNWQRDIVVNDSAVADFNTYLALYSPVINNIGLYKLHNEQPESNVRAMAGNYSIAIQTANAIHDEIPAEITLPAPGLANYIQYIYETHCLHQVRFGKWDENTKDEDEVILLANAYEIIHFARGIAYSRKHMFTTKKNCPF